VVLGSQSKVRGGPWCRRVLPIDDLAEIHELRGRTSDAWIRNIAAWYPRGSLACHLKGECYRLPANVTGARLNSFTFSTAPSSQPVVCFTSTKKRASRPGSPGKPGKPGNHSRKSQRARGILKRPSAQHTRLHRGTDPIAARERENAKRIR
jgi:hypothetical protein